MIALASIFGLSSVLFAVIFATLRSLPEKDDAPQPLADFATASGSPKRRRNAQTSTIDNALLARAIEATANLADRRGFLSSIERQLRSGDIPVRAAEATFFWAVAVVVIAPVAFLLVGFGAKFALVMGVAGYGPLWILRRYVKSRKKKFDRQLPDMLGAVSASLRAGRGVGHAMENLSKEMPDPMGRELRKIVAENQLGWPLSGSLDQASERIESPDFDWAVMAIRIQAEVGGNLAELLDQVADTMRQRERFRGEVKALTAEGTATAILLVAMPPVLGLVMFVLNKSYVEVLITTPVGNTILGVSVAMLVLGWFAMKRVMRVDV